MDGKITHLSLVSMILGEPLAISEPGLRLVLAVASREQEIIPLAVQQYGGVPVEESRRLSIRSGGVGVIPIVGPIMRHSSMFSSLSGAYSVEAIARDLGTALKSTEIQSIILSIDSPGGEVNGIAELAGLIREADAKKPVTAYVGYRGQSAAYYLASSASRIVANESSFVGSIGVIAGYRDTRKLQESMGIQDIEIVSSQSPKKNLDPVTDEGRAAIQEQVDFLAERFLADVSRNRGVSLKRVREDFGQGASVPAPQALSAGMIDDLGTMEGVVRSVAGGRRYRKSSVSVGSSPPSGSSAMAKTFGEWFGTMWNKPVPAHLESQDDPILETSQDASKAGGTESLPGSASGDTAELKRQLDDANAQLAKAVDERMETRVNGWVGKHIHPHQKAGVLAHCRKLADADRKLSLSGSESLLENYVSHMEAQDMGLLSDAVAQGKVPAGGRVETPPTSPEVPTEADPWAKSREGLASTANGQASNGSHK